MFFASEGPPASKLFDVMLIVHVGFVAVTLMVVGALYLAAGSLAKTSEGSPWPASGARFFTPGREIAGRLLYGIPATGILLLMTSEGHYGWKNPFVIIGLALWLVGIALGEGLVFPAASSLRRMVAASPDRGHAQEPRRLTRRLQWGIDGIVLVLVAGAIFMVAQP